MEYSVSCEPVFVVKRLSVVIANYNYDRYVAAAIESALALRWDDVEVVVVDDGSTDGSPAVIRRYADRVTVLMTENAGQRVAANRGYALTTGDVVLFLDSDDVLPPDLPIRLAEAWRPEVSKAQFQMQRIDEAGVPSGAPFPDYRPVPTPEDIRRWASETTAYPTPPGSGNAYARTFLDRIFPVDESVGDASDSACLAAAPFFGDVVSVPGVVVGYRRHGANDSNLLRDDRRFPREVARARARWRFAQRACGARDAAIDERPLFRSRELLQLRVAARRVAPAERPLPGDSQARMLRDAVRAPFQVGPESPLRRVVIAVWCIATLTAPLRVARHLISMRYGRRP
jgi:glycosyltransferase involved in cell wall biosynthesis